MKTSAKNSFLLCVLFAFLLCCSPSERGVIVLCAGDSLTESSYPRFLKNILNTAGIRAKVLNFGRPGNTTGEYLSYLINNKESLAGKHPDIVCLLLGTNDIRNDHDNTSTDSVYSNLKEILSIFSQFKDPDGNKTQILLSTIPPIPDGVPFPFNSESQERALYEINPLILKIGQEEKLPVVDNTSVFLEEPNLLPEVHPTEEGYRRLAQNWFEALRPFLKDRKPEPLNP